MTKEPIVRKARESNTQSEDKIERLSSQLRKDYEDVRHQAKWNYWTSQAFSVAGIVLICAGIGLVIGGSLEIGVLSVVVGVVMQPASMLFKRADKANIRVDCYHAELLGTQQFEDLLEACKKLSSPEKQDLWTERVIEAAIGQWLRWCKPETQPRLTRAKESMENPWKKSVENE